MIIGTGIDIVEIDRFKKAIERHPKLIDRLFTIKEKEYCQNRNKPHLHFAVRFAAKEAAVKSLGVGMRNITWKDIEIVKLNNGKPTISLHNQAKIIAKDKQINFIDVSLSFSKASAIANAIATNGLIHA